jgi:hypothetical protein
LINPVNVVVDSNERIIVLDDGVGTAIDIYDSELNHITSFGTITTPIGIDVDSNDRIIVSDGANDDVQVFDSSGNFLTTFGGSGAGDGLFTLPTRLSVDSNDQIIVPDSNLGTSRIQVFAYATESSSSTCHVPPTFGTPFTCAVRNFVDNGITIHRVSYDPTNELHIENPQINAVVGLPYSIKLAPYDSEGQSNIKWVAVSIGLVEGDFVFGNGQALAYLHQSYDGTFTVEEDDPTDVIEVMSFSKVGEQQCAVSDNDAMCPIYELKYKYREAPIDNMVGVQVVNQDGASENRFFNDGIDVTGDSMNPSPVIEVLADEKFVAKHYLTFVDPSFKDRTVAVDENGIIWNKVGNFWTTEHLMPDRSCSVGATGLGYDRTCPEFAMQVQGQELVALNTLDTMHPNINHDEPFSELDKIIAYEYPTTSQRELTSLQKTIDWYNAH